jgi:hypothetical protein
MDIGTNDIREPIVAVEAGAILADLNQPGPDLIGRRIDRDRA